MLTRDEFVMGLAPVIAMFPKEKPPADTLEVYYLALLHVPADVFTAAVWAVLRTHSYGFPKAGDIHDAAVLVVMERNELSEGWARQTLDDYRRAAHLQLAAGNEQPQLTAGIGRTK